MSDTNYLEPGEQIKPNIDETLAIKLTERLYGLKVKQIKQLNAYDDKNYHLICEANVENPFIQTVEHEGYVLKIINSLDSQKTDYLEGQTNMLIFLNQQKIECPVPVKQKSGSYFSLEVLETESLLMKKDDTNKRHAVRLLVFKPGALLSEVSVTEDLMVKIGHLTVKLDYTLAGFSHPAFENHKCTWDLQTVPYLRNFVFAVQSKTDRDFVNLIINEFEEKVIKNISNLKRGLIHGDLNEQNIIVDYNGENVKAVIDFGDSHMGYLVFELAIVMCYMIILTKDVKIGRYVIKGYQKSRTVPEIEKKMLKLCICARMCQSLVMGAYSYKMDPYNEYLLTTQKKGWEVLKELYPIKDDDIYRIWKL